MARQWHLLLAILHEIRLYHSNVRQGIPLYS